MNIPGQHFFQTFGGQEFDLGCVAQNPPCIRLQLHQLSALQRFTQPVCGEVMPVPKGHGYVFAVEAKHCRGVGAPKLANLEIEV